MSNRPKACTTSECPHPGEAHVQRVLRALQLVEVINEDYADFVSLSTQLVNVDGAVARMHKPLGELKVCVTALVCSTEGTVPQREHVSAAGQL